VAAKLAARERDAKESPMAFLVARRGWAVCERNSVCYDFEHYEGILLLAQSENY
jgi:hypothetical protein